MSLSTLFFFDCAEEVPVEEMPDDLRTNSRRMEAASASVTGVDFNAFHFGSIVQAFSEVSPREAKRLLRLVFYPAVSKIILSLLCGTTVLGKVDFARAKLVGSECVMMIAALQRSYSLQSFCLHHLTCTIVANEGD